jgi:ArsR family transcriptional regulator, zinc-responsive transcriptional repressor
MAKRGPAKLTPLEKLEEAAECLKTVAHHYRLRIIQMLLEGDYMVSELAEACGIQPQMASEHLRLMQRSGLSQAIAPHNNSKSKRRSQR